jgi:RNA polymerase sigma-70 factor (ECF subfamily)
MRDREIRPPNSVETTSKSLLKRVQKGDQLAWQQLVTVYGPVVAYWIEVDRIKYDDANDIFQEVFTSVAKSIGRFEREDGAGKFRRWLKVITRNKVHDHFRNSEQGRAVGGDTAYQSLQRIPDAEVSDDELASAGELDETENAIIVQEVLKTIKGEFREATWLSFWLTTVEDRNATNVGEELGLTPEAVRKNKSRVMTRLREALAAHGL